MTAIKGKYLKIGMCMVYNVFYYVVCIYGYKVYGQRELFCVRFKKGHIILKVKRSSGELNG